MNTTENNILIAEFMGVESYPYRGYTMFIFDDNNHRTDVDLHYHTSWEWLMPVVEKIEDLEVVAYEKNKQEEGDFQVLFTKGDDIFICHYAETSIEATYKAVVEFIKWYNNEKITK